MGAEGECVNMQLRMLRSLGFYITVKRMENVTQADFESALDYHDFLRDVESKAVSGAGFGGFTADNQLIPLDDITLTQIQYGDAINQMFAGQLSHMQLTLPYPPPPVVAPPVRERAYFESYLSTLGKDGDPRTKADVESIMERTNKLLSEREVNEQRVNGLVVGRVQSGKTRNYVGLMLKAVDEGWNTVLVLTSPNTLLRDQTQSRIEEDFKKSEANAAVFLNFRSGRGRDITRPSSILDDTNSIFYWGVVMKQKTNLERVLEWLHSLDDAVVKKMRLLVIDDEADNATPDSNAGRRNQLTESEIDELIDSIREDENGYSDLADWMVDVQDLIVDAQSVAEQDPGCKTACDIAELKRKLNAGGYRAAERLNEILTDDRISSLLELHAHQDESGNMVNVAEDIRRYFCGGRGFEPIGTFFKFLNTLLDIAQERSAINGRLCELIDRAPGSEANDYAFDFERMAYIAYTATPYANILNERPGQSPLYADFIKALTTAPQYFGLDKIFGRDYDHEPVIPPNMDIVDEIATDDQRFALRPIQWLKDPDLKRVLDVDIDKNLRITCDDPSYEGSWSSMLRAIAWAFCTAGARRHFRLSALNEGALSVERHERLTRKLDYRWTTMMVNISSMTYSHFTVCDYVKDYIHIRCETPEMRAAFLEECRLTWEDMTAHYTKDMFDDAFNSDEGERYGEIADYPYWGDIEADVGYFLDGWDDDRVHAVVINSKSPLDRDGQDGERPVRSPKEEADRYNQTGPYSNSLRDDHLWIVIGGNTIGRGLTLTGLTVSYFDRVRKSVAVDTLTQMGRWFGYRKDYELLPRVFMTEETVKEMKRTAFIEGAMHEAMKVNFDNGYSPKDPEHYQKIYSWGRKLSGRARAQVAFTGRLGSLTTTNAVSAARSDIEAVYSITKDFVRSLGQQAFCPRPRYKYGDAPLWVDVDKNVVKEYINEIMPHYPEETRLSMRAMVKEIEHTAPLGERDIRWNVVIGEPARLWKDSYPIGLGRDIHAGHPQSAKIEDGVIKYGSVRTDMAFYAMIETRYINMADAKMLEDGIADVVSAIERKKKSNGGNIPAVIANAIAAYDGNSLERRILALVEDVSRHPEKEVPRGLMDCLGESIGNRSAIAYRETLYDISGVTNPIMQIYLVTPPDEVDAGKCPIIVPAFYWPDHSPDNMSLVSIGMEPVSNSSTSQKFWDVVAEVLRRNGFPMSAAKLKEAVHTAASEYKPDFIDRNIANPPGGVKYAKVPDKAAYYHTDWANDPVEKIRRFVLDKAADILRRGGVHPRPINVEDLSMQIVTENPKLEGLFNPKSREERNRVFANENLPSIGLGREGSTIFVR